MTEVWLTFLIKTFYTKPEFILRLSKIGAIYGHGELHEVQSSTFVFIKDSRNVQTTTDIFGLNHPSFS